MKLYEFEGKRLFDRAGIETPPGKVVATPGEAVGLTREFGPVMAKAQVLRGGRAKEQAVIPCDDETQLANAVRSLVGRKLSGETVDRVLVERKLDVAKEVFAAVIYAGASPALILSASGGVDVEKASHESQEGVVVEPINILRGLEPEKAAELARRAGLDAGAADVLLKLYRMFIDCDATLAEINPLVQTHAGRWIAADAKVEIDDDAMFRQTSLNLPERLASGRTPDVSRTTGDGERSD